MTTATIEPGTIFKSSWGYDQTNIDFYKVTKKTATSVYLQKVGSQVVEVTGWAHQNVIPDPAVEIGQPFRRKVQAYPLGTYVSINSCASASLWDGNPSAQSQTC